MRDNLQLVLVTAIPILFIFTFVATCIYCCCRARSNRKKESMKSTTTPSVTKPVAAHGTHKAVTSAHLKSAPKGAGLPTRYTNASHNYTAMQQVPYSDLQPAAQQQHQQYQQLQHHQQQHHQQQSYPPQFALGGNTMTSNGVAAAYSLVNPAAVMPDYSAHSHSAGGPSASYSGSVEAGYVTNFSGYSAVPQSDVSSGYQHSLSPQNSHVNSAANSHYVTQQSRDGSNTQPQW